MSYDPKDDVLAVAVEGIEHNIRHPKQIFVEQDAESLYSGCCGKTLYLASEGSAQVARGVRRQGFLNISR